MKDILNKILDLIDNLPAGFQALALLILALLITAYKMVSNKKIQRAIILKIQKKLGYLTKNDLKTHRLFSRKDIYKNAINSIDFNNKIKTRIFRKILSVKLESDLKLANEFVEKLDLSKINKHELCNSMIAEVNGMVQAYESISLDSLQHCFGIKTGKELFNFIMNSPGGFREKRADRLNRIIFQVDEFLRASQVFDNNTERLEYFLTEILYALRTSILEAEKVFETLNGGIDEIINKNK